MKRPPDLCTACREPLGSARLQVRDSDPNGLSGQFHVAGCLEGYALLVETEKGWHRFVGVAAP